MDLSGASASGVIKVFYHLWNSGLLVRWCLTGGLVTISGIVEYTSYENDLLLDVKIAMKAQKGPCRKLQVNIRMYTIFDRSY